MADGKMNWSFDTIVGPDGVWKDDWTEPVDDYGLTAREAFALRCLNAAANLYGILTVDEFVSLYNGYAKDHESAVARAMTAGELDGMIGRLIEVCHADDGQSDSVGDIVDRPECWFGVWDYRKTGHRMIVQAQFVNFGPDGTPTTPGEYMEKLRRHAEKRISRTVGDFVKVELKILPEDDFLEYEEPTYSEGTDETERFEKFLVEEYGLSEDQAGLDVWGIQGEIRCNGATATNAFEYIRDCCEWAPESLDAEDRLLKAISPVLDDTRIWRYRGHTELEMLQLGLVDTSIHEDVPDVFGLADDVLDMDCDDCIHLEDLPKPVYNGPIDFKFVKDPALREAKMEVYANVRQIMDELGEKYLGEEFKTERMVDAAVRLGCLKRGESIDSLAHDKFLAVADFVTVFDDAKGGPSVRRLAKKKDKLDDFERLALEYYSSARYTWLVIEAVKAGCGMKCRDLLTGEALFLIDKSCSMCDVKGRTLCVGVIPMGDVYIASGAGSLVYLKDPEAELREVFAQVGLLDTRPVCLSFRDQARFVEATFRHLQKVRRQS